LLFRIETIRFANAIISVNASNVLKMCLTSPPGGVANRLPWLATPRGETPHFAILRQISRFVNFKSARADTFGSEQLTVNNEQYVTA